MYIFVLCIYVFCISLFSVFLCLMSIFVLCMSLFSLYLSFLYVFVFCMSLFSVYLCLMYIFILMHNFDEIPRIVEETKCVFFLINLFNHFVNFVDMKPLINHLVGAIIYTVDLICWLLRCKLLRKKVERYLG